MKIAAKGVCGCQALSRMREKGFSLRPDNTPVTASIGVAEFPGNGVESWQQLVELADKRMYAAKQGGRDRIVGCDQYGDEACANCAASVAADD